MMQIDMESQRFRRGIRFFTYGLMTMATITLTTLVILLAMGYRFDRNQLGVIREGLLQLASHPVDVHYKINGKDYKNLTPDKQTLPAGRYTIDLYQDGYRPWQKQIDIVAGHVHWINYPRLIPENLTTKTVKDFVNASFTKASPDKRWVIMNPGGQDRDKLELLDFKNPEQVTSTTVTIPETQLTKKDGKLGELQFVEWSLDSKQFIVKHLNGDVLEFIKIDRAKPAEAVNLNLKFQFPVDDAHFSGGSTSILFVRTKDVLRRLDVGANTATGALMSHVRDYRLFGDDSIVFTRLKDGQPTIQEVGIRLEDKDIVLKEMPEAEDVTAEYNEFDEHTYFVIANRTKQITSIYRDITILANRQKTFAEFDGLAPQYVKFSGNARFLLLQQGSKFGVYDFYEGQKFGYSVAGLSETQPARFLDDFHISGVKDGKLQMWDFDGTNRQELVAAQPELEPLVDEDDDILYTFTKAQAGSSTSRPYNLTSTSLKVTQ